MAVAVAERVPSALSAAGYYLLAYLLMNLGAFVVAAQLERLTGSDEMRGLRGLGQRSPLAAVGLTLSLLSLAGIPPLAGFAGKVLLLDVTLSGGLTWLAVIAIVNFAVALYYYLLPIVEMYLRAPETESRVPNWPGYLLALGISVFGTLLFGVLPSTALSVTQYLGRVFGG